MLRPQPALNAGTVRRWPCKSYLLAMLLACGGFGVSRAHAQETAPGPEYQTVVVAQPPVVPVAREDRAASASAVVIADRTPRASDSVTQILSEQAGATVTRLGGLGSTATLSLRGSTANQVLLYVDGVPLNTVTGGGVDLGAIPIGDTERIEIYRGMSPIVFGTSAIGGVVSISTAVPTENRVTLDAGGGSFGTYYGGARGVWSHSRVHVYGGVHALTSEGDFPYTNTKTNGTASDDVRTRRRNNDLKQVDGALRLVLDVPEDRRIKVGLLFFGRSQGLPGDADVDNVVTRLGTTRVTATLGYESPQAFGPGGRWKVTLFGNYDLSHFDDPYKQINSIPTDAHDRIYTFGGTTTWRHVTRPWLVLSGLLDLRYDRFSASDTDVSGSPGTRLWGATGLESDFWIEKLRLDVIPSVRVEMSRESTSGRNNFYKLLPTSAPVTHTLPIVRLALIEKLTGWLSLRANAGRYARLPSLIELYGNTGLLLGDPTLKPERGLNADIGSVLSWKGESSRVWWSTAAFMSYIDNLIQYQYGGGHARPRNLGSARILGVESEVALELGKHFRTFLSATFSDPRSTSVVGYEHDRLLPLRPRYRVYLRPEWRAVQVTPRISFGFYAEADATGRNYLTPDNVASVPARLLLGAGTYADLPAGFSVRFTAQNLTNASVNDLNKLPLPGRECYVALAWTQPNKKQGESL